MLSGDDLTDEFEALSLARTCLDLERAKSRPVYKSLPKKYTVPKIEGRYLIDARQ